MLFLPPCFILLAGQLRPTNVKLVFCGLCVRSCSAYSVPPTPQENVLHIDLGGNHWVKYNVLLGYIVALLVLTFLIMSAKCFGP